MAAKGTRPKDEQPEASGETSTSKPLAPEPARPKAAPEPAAEPEPQAKTTLAAPAAEQPKTARYRVWSHGTLQRNGKTYNPGEEITLSIEDASKIPCLEKA